MKATQCCYPPCAKPAAKGRHFCTSHEYRWRKGGEAAQRPPKGASTEDVLRHIGWTVTDSGCWEWNGYRSNGYGRLRGEPVTRLMWKMTTGEDVAPDRHMCHKCDNPPCVNPAHLFVGTRSDNMRDMVDKGRHPYVKGERNHSAKLTDEQVAEIRARYSGAWGEYTELAHAYGVSVQHVRAIVRGERR